MSNIQIETQYPFDFNCAENIFDDTLLCGEDYKQLNGFESYFGDEDLIFRSSDWKEPSDISNDSGIDLFGVKQEIFSPSDKIYQSSNFLHDDFLDDLNLKHLENFTEVHGMENYTIDTEYPRSFTNSIISDNYSHLTSSKIVDTVESILNKPVKVLLLPTEKKIPLKNISPPVNQPKSFKFISKSISSGGIQSNSLNANSKVKLTSNFAGQNANLNTNGVGPCFSSAPNMKVFVPMYPNIIQTELEDNVVSKKQKLGEENMIKLMNSNVQIQPKLTPLSTDAIYELCKSSPNSSDSDSNLRNLSPLISDNNDITSSKKKKVLNYSANDEISRRHQRMIKNRESASLSRKRKKEFVTSLQDQLNETEQENERLKKENSILKQQIVKLQAENGLLKVGKPVVKVTAFLSICLLISLNFGGLRNFESSIETKSNLFESESQSRFGRKLSSLEFSSESYDNFKEIIKLNESSKLNESAMSDLNRRFNEHNLKLVKEMTDKLMCGNYFNTTESMRLMDELRGWVNGHEESLKIRNNLEEYKHANEYARTRNSAYNKPKPRHIVNENEMDRKQRIRMKEMKAESANRNKYEMELYAGLHQTYDQFLSEIRRRNDTFYVVSFRNDHLLLPATSHNKTTRPRMSLMMPAFGLNDTLKSFGNIAMMQIDCDVTATRLIRIKKSTIPTHLQTNSSSRVKGRRYHGDDYDKIFSDDGATRPKLRAHN